MDVYLDSTEYKRIDLCMDYKVNTGEVKERRFVVRWGNKQRAFENFIEAVAFYKVIDEDFKIDSGELIVRLPEQFQVR